MEYERKSGQTIFVSENICRPIRGSGSTAAQGIQWNITRRKKEGR